ncbi:MAG: hypothetical protein AAF570_00060 [Bacteroidota bacterium]
MGIGVGGFLVAAVIAFFIINKPLPEGKEGPQAEALAKKMLSAVNAEAWAQIPFVRWSYAGGHDFLWDMQRNLVEIKWGGGEWRVLANPTAQTGLAYQNGNPLSGEEAAEKVKKGIHLFWNDSFWFNGFLKVFDPGTTRKYVEREGSQEGLLVTYNSGGTTPGDSYLWLIEADGMPSAYQMWVDIIPFGGLEFSWAGWATFPNGAKYPQIHDSWLKSLQITNIKSGNSLMEMGHNTDIFSEIATN